MTDRPKAKPAAAKGRNTDRRNGKAVKKPGASRTRKTPISELMKAQLGHGVLDRYRRPMTAGEADNYHAEKAARAS